jgi:hypothetical protein
MKDYVRVEVVSESKVDQYLSDGWEVIEALKYSEEYGNTNRVEYHVGLPSRVWANQLLAVIRGYEAKGFKEKLVEAFAESHGQKASDYTTLGYHGSNDETAVFIKRYEAVVNNKNVTVSKETSEEDIEIDF